MISRMVQGFRGSALAWMGDLTTTVVERDMGMPQRQRFSAGRANKLTDLSCLVPEAIWNTKLLPSGLICLSSGYSLIKAPYS